MSMSYTMPTLRRHVVALAAAFLLLPAYGETTLFRDIPVFDGMNRLPARSVLVQDGKIADANFKGDTPEGAREVHCDDCTLMPGLIDSHVHAYKDLDLPLLFGVTTQLDMFMAIEAAKPIKADMARGKNRHAADLYTAGTLITAPGGHGTEYGLPIPTLTKPEDADAFVKARIDEGSDYIKLIYDSGLSIGEKFPTLDLPTLTAAIQAAHKYHKLAVVHVQDLEAARQAIAAGADGLAHLFEDKPADAAFVKLAKDRGAFIVPTYTVFESFSGRRAADGLLATPEFKGLLDDSQLVALNKIPRKIDLSARLDMLMHSSITALRDAGVPILAGTDAGNPGVVSGISLHRELELLVKAGLTPTEALRAATSAPAKAFQLADRGRVANGMVADLLLVKGDPTHDILATRHIVDIWKDGEEVGKLREARIAEISAKAAAVLARPAAKLPEGGRLADFSSTDLKSALHSAFGNWQVSTDSVMQGKSVVSLKTQDGSLLMDGEIKPGSVLTWAGASFMPAGAPINLSNVRAVSFKVRGDEGVYSLQAFCESGGYIPAVASFSVNHDWREVTINFDKLSGFDAKGATMFSWTAGQKMGPFHLELRDITLVAKN